MSIGPQHRPATQREIAAKSGYSLATVSMALRDSPKITEAVRHQIRAVARELGYRPNPLIAAHWHAVRSRQTPRFHSTIAILNDHDETKTWKNSPWGGEILEGFRRRAEELGYTTEEIHVGHREDAGRRERLAHAARMMRARGMNAYAILYCAHPRIFMEMQEHYAEFAGVFISSQLNVAPRGEEGEPPHLPFHRVNPDRYGNMCILMDRIRELGYRRPGYWPNHWMEGVSAGEAASSFNFAIRNLPPKNRIPSVPEAWELSVSHLTRKSAFCRWLDRHRPDVIVCENYEVRQWVRETGRDIPGDIGLVHLSLGPMEKHWSGINPHLDRIASAAADLLTAHLQRNERGVPPFSKEIRIDGEWVSGETTRRAR